jgi:hypothetical protein
VNGSLLGEEAASELADALAVSGVPACPLCLSELAWEFHEGRVPDVALVARTVAWIWPEIKDAVREEVVTARMKEIPFAEDALRDLEETEWRSPLVHRLVERLARRLADELP